MLHHYSKEFNDDFTVGPEEHLPLAPFLSIVDGLQSVCQNIHADHFEFCNRKMSQSLQS